MQFLNRAAREGITEKVTLKQRPEGVKRWSRSDIWWKGRCGKYKYPVGAAIGPAGVTGSQQEPQLRERAGDQAKRWGQMVGGPSESPTGSLSARDIVKVSY